MLTSNLLHPEILGNLATCGHGDKILICDGNYPIDSNVNSKTERIYLALKPGLPKVTDVLKALNTCVNFEKAEVMSPGNVIQPEIFGEFEHILGTENLAKLERQEFYETCKSSVNLKLAVSTAETRVFANILLTVAPVINV